jgi:hypothetical protein
MTLLDSKLPPLAPLYFFQLKVELKEGKKTLLPTTSELLGEERFAEVKLGWSDEGLFGDVDVLQPFEGASYPNYEEGDAIELFIDTRDLKEAGFPTKFCHHFLILPYPVQGVQALELTRFREVEQRMLCDPTKIDVKTKSSKRGYTVSWELPAAVLHGFDPKAFDRLGMTYSIHRSKQPSQHFACSPQFVSVAQNPSLWASCLLVR